MPYVVNATETGLDIALEFRRQSGCHFDEFTPPPRLFYQLWDKHGKIDATQVSIDGAAPHVELRVPLEGNPPWLLMGDQYPCHNPHQSFLREVTSGYPLNLAHGFSHNPALVWRNTTISLDIGQMNATAEWSAPSLAWHLADVRPKFVHGEGGFVGRIKAYFPDGLLLRQHNYSAQGAHSVYGEVAQMAPGAFRIHVEASLPPPQPIVIEYGWQFLTLDARICNYGFEWDLCAA